MKKKLWLILSLGLLLLAISLTGCSSITSPPAKTAAGSSYNNQSTGIWVSGTGRVTAVPNLAVLSLGIQTQASTVDQAQAQATSSMNAVVSALKAGGVADKDIRTQVFSIQQLTRYDDKTQKQVIIGYQVTNTVTVKVRKVADTGSVIDAVVKVGGDSTRINSISFTVDDPTLYQTDARQKAMADAKARAKQLADAAGVKLGAPTYINESGGIVSLPTVPMAVAQTTGAGTTPISAGEIDITVNVQVAYSID